MKVETQDGNISNEELAEIGIAIARPLVEQLGIQYPFKEWDELLFAEVALAMIRFVARRGDELKFIKDKEDE